MLYCGLLAVMYACEKTPSDMKSADLEDLKKLKATIIGQVDTAICEDPSEWDFTALGSKACGGPQEYIAFPHSIDTVLFLGLVAEYTAAEQRFNEKYGVVSDCMAVLSPSGIECDDGKPVLISNTAETLK